MDTEFIYASSQKELTSGQWTAIVFHPSISTVARTRQRKSPISETEFGIKKGTGFKKCVEIYVSLNFLDGKCVPNVTHSHIACLQ
jgi:hypothetical protein